MYEQSKQILQIRCDIFGEDPAKAQSLMVGIAKQFCEGKLAKTDLKAARRAEILRSMPLKSKKSSKKSTCLKRPAAAMDPQQDKGQQWREQVPEPQQEPVPVAEARTRVTGKCAEKKKSTLKRLKSTASLDVPVEAAKDKGNTTREKKNIPQVKKRPAARCPELPPMKSWLDEVPDDDTASFSGVEAMSSGPELD